MVNSTQSTDNSSWNNLPYVPLVLIFQLLDYQDRFNASLVCHDWSVAFDCPALWKDVSLIFRGDMVEDSRKAILFAKKHATSTKNLKMRFPSNNEACSIEVLNNVQLLFEYLFSSQLNSFELENFLWDSYPITHSFNHISQVMEAFKAFLAAQKNLRKLTFYNMRFTGRYGLSILTEVSKRNGLLQELGLVHFFEETLDIHNNPVFQNLLNSFSKLRTLSLSYQCISAEILNILCNSGNLGLQELSVTCSFREDLRHRIPNRSWSVLRRTFPEVEISFEVVEIVSRSQIESLVLPATQMNVFSYKCGFTLQTEQNLQRHGLAIIRYLRRHFSHSLHCILLDFGFVGIPSLERALVSLLRNCKMLRKIVLSGVLRSEVASRVCEIALQQESEIKDLLLMFFFTSIESMDEMVRLTEYKQQLREKGVNFTFNLLSS